jgi:hypothetical protein
MLECLHLVEPLRMPLPDPHIGEDFIPDEPLPAFLRPRIFLFGVPLLELSVDLETLTSD